MNLITEQQMKLIHVLLQQMCSNKTQLDKYKNKIKEHYKVPSTWQLTSEQAGRVIDRLSELLEQSDQTELVEDL